MIILEFRFQEHFQKASTVLEACKVQFFAESVKEDWRPNRICLFEHDLSTGPQREALRRAKDFEKEDQRLLRRRPVPNMALPS
jgi:hypothetical protein